MTTIPHSARCSRPDPIARRSWSGAPELFCRACGRSSLLDRMQADLIWAPHASPGPVTAEPMSEADR